MLAETKDVRSPVAALVGPHSVEHAEAVVERVGQHGKRCGVPVDELPVEPDLLYFVDHRGASFGASGAPQSV